MKIKFRYIMLVMALAVASCGAYFSVWGLSQLFAGAARSVIIMASILEVSKIITTTALHTYWDKLAKTLKIYLTISVVILMIITSAGIYGFLSNAYQMTANKLEIHEGSLEVLNSKKQIFERNIDDNQKIIDFKTKRLEQLSGLRTTQENRFDESKTNGAKRGVRRDISNANSEIQKLTGDIDLLNEKNKVLSDSVAKYKVANLNMKASSTIAGEVGPLKYISALTGIPMARVVNYLILLLIFVFDPLAIALILATNRVFEIQGKQTPLEPKLINVQENVTRNIEPVEQTEQVQENISDNTEPIEPIEQVKQEDTKLVEETEPIEQVKQEDIKLVEETEPIEQVKQEDTKLVEETEPLEEDKQEDIKLVEETEPIEEDENRGFSVKIPDNKKNNVIERIGSNKLVKNGDTNKFYYKRE